MKILRISGKNLASLAGEFNVDFEQEPLASSGLFAISGPTGAGKSTLLDALCLALYDATPRLLKAARGASLPDVGMDTVSVQDPRTLLRRGAGEAHAEVDFVGNDNLRYRARWSVRRSRGKVGGGLQKSSMTLHRLPDLAALGGTKTEVADEIAQRIGLTFEQFTRAVLLAQNEFSAFLKTDENERGELLETLTGSAVYSAISKRAFERFRAEQATMKQLSARLADHTPLAAAERADLEQRSGAQDAALALLDARKLALEQQLRWHQEADKLRASEAQAEASLALALAAVNAAAPRRRRLDTLDAIEPARALLADSTRLESEAAAIQGAIGAAAEALQRALATQAQAAGALAAASGQLLAAEQARAAAQGDLDQAKALDASIAALAPSHARTAASHKAAGEELAAAAQVLAARADELAETRAAHHEGGAWLAAHQHRESLAAEWPRWHTLLGQAGQQAARSAALEAELAAAQAALAAASAADAQAAAALAASASELAALEAARQHAIASLATFDAEQLSKQRLELDLRRDQLARAEHIWKELTAARASLEQRRAQASSHAAARGAAAAALDTAQAAAAPLQAALAQAERSLKAAELACADNVADLRATLADGEPCPVCGSEEHPYQHQNAALQGMLENLRSEVARCRGLAQDNSAAQATARAQQAGSEQQLAAALADVKAQEAALQTIEAAWQASPLAAQSGSGESLASSLEAVKAGSSELDRQERAQRSAGTALGAAQTACDEMAGRHARARDSAAAARASLDKTLARHAALSEQRRQAAQDLDTLLTELDAAFPAIAHWRRDWQAGAAAFHQAREAEVRQWRERSAQHAGRAAALVVLEAESAAAHKRHVQAQQAGAAAAAEFARIDADIGASKAQRGALWQGQAVREVEQALAAAIDNARAAVTAQQAASQLAAQAETRARESAAQLAARLAALQAQAADAARQLDTWLAAYPAQHPDQEAIADRASLAALLALERAWIAAERHALQAIGNAAASAATVLHERRGQRALHQQTATPGDDASAADLSEALAVLGAERQHALDGAGALRLQLAQDNVRRDSAQAMMAEIEQQQLIELRWGRMNELIGSADGKKFRNYAQQFTLDVLLGYANSHLGHLARRYRLERVPAAAGPSLGLLVRDQDMGGEIRSVNSLSGGESFLVSLALALGLASLSSNRVRVESLFIDEGFGSLDSETLRVAMDALDGLQSMGRKVGVISHVQEMTERIATRILVQPSGGGTSSVTVQ